MLTSTKAFIIAGIFIISSSCASIVSKSHYPVTIDSTPRGANVTITDKHGVQVYTGQTPSLVKLKSGAGFFANAKYDITISKPGFASKTVQLKATINGWYFGNFVFGGLIGLLIVDPATGAMYKLKVQDVNETLTAESRTTATETTVPKLRIYDVNDIPAEWKSKMVAIK
jgi:hypothetical protein